MTRVCSTSTILGTNGLNSADVPLSNKQTNLGLGSGVIECGRDNRGVRSGSYSAVLFLRCGWGLMCPRCPAQVYSSSPEQRIYNNVVIVDSALVFTLCH